MVEIWVRYLNILWMEEILHQLVTIGNYETLQIMELWKGVIRLNHLPTGAGLKTNHPRVCPNPKGLSPFSRFHSHNSRLYLTVRLIRIRKLMCTSTLCGIWSQLQQGHNCPSGYELYTFKILLILMSKPSMISMGSSNETRNHKKKGTPAMG
jgi:hypothetical protein